MVSLTSTAGKQQLRSQSAVRGPPVAALQAALEACLQPGQAPRPWLPQALHAGDSTLLP